MKRLCKNKRLCLLVGLLLMSLLTGYLTVGKTLVAGISQAMGSKDLGGLKIVTQIKDSKNKVTPLNDIKVSVWSESTPKYKDYNREYGCHYLSQAKQKVPSGSLVNLNYHDRWHYSGLWGFKTGAKYTYNKQTYANPKGVFYLGDGVRTTNKGGGMGFGILSTKCSPINVRVDKESQAAMLKTKSGKWVVKVTGLTGADKMVSSSGDLVKLTYGKKVTPVVTFTFEENKPPTPPNPAPVPTSKTLELTPLTEAPGIKPINGKVKSTIYGREKSKDEKFSIVVLPDTQYYVASKFNRGGANNTKIFNDQTNWVADQIKNHNSKYNIKFVAHLGDIVDDGADNSQWKRAKVAMDKLNHIVPYAISPGNHDFFSNASKYKTKSFEGNYKKYFSIDNLKKAGISGFSYKDNSRNTLHRVKSGNEEYNLLFLEYCPSDKVLDWAKNQLTSEKNKNVKTILVTHNFLYRTGHLTPGKDTPGLGGCREAGAKVGDNAGVGIWQKLITKTENIQFVLAGHTNNDEWSGGTSVAMQYSINGQQKNVNILLSNYQTKQNKTSGDLRIMTFYPDKANVEVRTFSPFRNRYLEDSDNLAVISKPDNKFSNSFKITGLKGTKASGKWKVLKEDNLNPNQKVKYEWKNLKANKAYEWFADISNSDEIKTTSNKVFKLE